MTEADKIESYDWLVKEISVREPSIHRLLQGSGGGYSRDPLFALLRAYDMLVDENKRYRLGDYDLTTPRRQRVR